MRYSSWKRFCLVLVLMGSLPLLAGASPHSPLSWEVKLPPPGVTCTYFMPDTIAIVANDNMVYVAGEGWNSLNVFSALYALDACTGKLKWRAEEPAGYYPFGPGGSPPISPTRGLSVSPSLVIHKSTSGYWTQEYGYTRLTSFIRAYHAQSGKIVWEDTINGFVSTGDLITTIAATLTLPGEAMSSNRFFTLFFDPIFRVWSVRAYDASAKH